MSQLRHSGRAQDARRNRPLQESGVSILRSQPCLRRNWGPAADDCAHPWRLPPGTPSFHSISLLRRQDRDFSAEQGSMVRKNNPLVARVAPTGRKIALSRDRIQNLSEVEAATPQQVAPGQSWPTPQERQILGYHKKHGTTSSRYEEVREKYPNW